MIVSHDPTTCAGLPKAGPNANVRRYCLARRIHRGGH
jgi:hypothetical protein